MPNTCHCFYCQAVAFVRRLLARVKVGTAAAVDTSAGVESTPDPYSESWLSF